MELAGFHAEQTRVPQPLRVCHVIDALRVGGAERQFVNILNALAGVERYALLVKHTGAGSELRPLLDPAIEVHCLPVRLRYAPYHIWRVARWLATERIDVVHAHMYWPSLYATLAARWAGTPVIVTTDHGTSPWKQDRHRWIERLTINRWADRRLGVSTNVLDTMRERVRCPASLLAPITNATEEAEPVALVDRRPLRLAAMGRFVWQKDYATLIEAAARLRDRGLDFRLSIAGDGPLQGDIRRQARDHGLERQIDLCGVQTDVDSWLRQQDLFVLSSREEGQPVVILEAMARGLPIVATRVGGVPDTVRHEQEALLAPVRDPDALAAAIHRLADDFELRRLLGQRARARLQQEYSASALAQRHLRLYAEILRGKGMAADAAALN